MKQKNTGFWIVLFLSPTIIIFLLIFGFPLLTVVWTSFTKWKLTQPIEFVGLHNFIYMFTVDSDAQMAMRNTLVWVLIQSTFHVGLGTLLALMAFQKKRTWKILSTSYMIPNIISPVVRAMIMVFVFNPQFGLLNSFIQILGFEGFDHNWLFDTDTAFLTVTLGWALYAAVIMLLINSQIVSIPQAIIDSAKVDGASMFQIKIYIILPLLKGIIGTCIILAATSMLKEFEMLFITTQGGPGNCTISMPLYLYKTALLENNFGYANAIGVVMILFGLMIISIINKIFNMDKNNG